MVAHRINARLPRPLAEHVAHVVGENGLYETPSEYIRALIRQDMARDTAQIYSKIREGFEDIAQGRILKSRGSWVEDKKSIA
ncbi:MAG: type II toxin-antitoxin system ParD family antitoxin [Holosporales bacterium]